jgi:hypothetical protein
MDARAALHGGAPNATKDAVEEIIERPPKAARASV